MTFEIAFIFSPEGSISGAIMLQIPDIFKRSQELSEL